MTGFEPGFSVSEATALPIAPQPLPDDTFFTHVIASVSEMPQAPLCTIPNMNYFHAISD